MVVVIGVFILVAVGLISLTITSRHPSLSSGINRIIIAFVGPFQGAVTHSVNSVQDIWFHYFYLVSAAKENRTLKKAVNESIAEKNRYNEIELSNTRLRNFLNFQTTKSGKVLAAEVVGKDPSPWFKTIIINKGEADGVQKGYPVVVPEGIAGKIIEVSDHYSKVLLITDRNSGVDALVQRSRARGIVVGESTDQCFFEYVLRKKDVVPGDNVITSGMDGIYPKGLRIGIVHKVVKRDAGMFQAVKIFPYVDFEKLEEVLVILHSPRHTFVSK